MIGIGKLLMAGSGGAGDATVAFVSVNPSGNAGIRSYDISDPTDITAISTFTSSDFGTSTGPSILLYDASAKIIYAVHSGTSKIVSVNVANPSSMSQLDALSLSGASENAVLDKANNRVVVSGSSRGASSGDRVFINISNPSSMSVSSTTNDGDFSSYVISSSTFLRTDRGYEGIPNIVTSTLFSTQENDSEFFEATSYDLSTKHDSLSGATDFGGTTFNPSTSQVRLGVADFNRGYFFAAYNEGILVINVSDRTNLSGVKLIPASPSASSPLAKNQDIAIDRGADILYVASANNDAISSVDVSNINNISILDTLSDSDISNPAVVLNIDDVHGTNAY